MAALRRMLITTRGRMLLISSPAGGGSYSHELYERAWTEEASGLERFTFIRVDGGWIPPSEVESNRATLFWQEYYASFESLVGPVSLSSPRL